MEVPRASVCFVLCITEHLPYGHHLYQFPFSLLAKYQASSHLKKEGLILVHSLRGQSTTVRKSWGQAWEAAGHICMQSVGREERSSLKMWFGVDGARQSWYESNQTEGHQLIFSAALRLDTWTASGCRTDAGLEATGRDFSKRSPGRGLRRAMYSPCAGFPCPEDASFCSPQSLSLGHTLDFCPQRFTLWPSLLFGHNTCFLGL